MLQSTWSTYAAVLCGKKLSKVSPLYAILPLTCVACFILLPMPRMFRSTTLHAACSLKLAQCNEQSPRCATSCCRTLHKDMQEVHPVQLYQSPVPWPILAELIWLCRVPPDEVRTSSPGARCSLPASALSSVVFPAPGGPSSSVNRPCTQPVDIRTFFLDVYTFKRPPSAYASAHA